MSDSATKKHRDGTDGKQYFVRVRDGAVFGPVPPSELSDWVESGNTMPGDEISTDREHWGLAMNLPELRMDVMIDRGDGSFQGPFNEKSVEHLIKNGAIPANARRMSFADFMPVSTTGAPDSDIREELRTEMEERLETTVQQARDAIAERDRQIETLTDALAEKNREIAAENKKTTNAAENAGNAARLRELENEFAELLEFSNTRDAENAAKLEQAAQHAAQHAAEREDFAEQLKNKDIVIAKWQAANSSLNHRIKELEKGAGSLFN